MCALLNTGLVFEPSFCCDWFRSLSRHVIDARLDDTAGDAGQQELNLPSRFQFSEKRPEVSLLLSRPPVNRATLSSSSDDGARVLATTGNDDLGKNQFI